MYNGINWWEDSLRVIQPNLQVRDTERINPEKLAKDMEDMGANAMVFNVGGIYAWYDTEVPFHNKNEFLPRDFDLMKEVIKECHKRNIKFIARFDFSKGVDYIYLNRPQWFVRDLKNEPQIIGAKRPGNWSLLMSTCINSSYRGEAVAIPVLDEVMTKYEIDGIFYNNPGFIPCWCESCRRKYKAVYGKELPSDPKEFEETWSQVCVHDNIEKLYSFIKEKNKDIPMILYYNPNDEKLLVREKITDMLCTEPQDVLSLGHKNLPPVWKPSLSIKMGRTLHNKPYPFGIIHSCPGMDWRHTGLPSAEYLFWLSLVPANGGHIWHSITGIPDTIRDKRLLRTVSQVNGMIKKVEGHMKGADIFTQVVLMWDGSSSAEGWADCLTNTQIPYEPLLQEQASEEKLKSFKVVVIPGNWNYTEDFVKTIKGYVEQGGSLVIEGDIPSQYSELYELIGVSNEIYSSENLLASYLRFEGEDNPLCKGMEDTGLIPHRGRVIYCTPEGDAKVMATLVPPFSPLESVGAPPERASLPVEKTDIPLCIFNKSGSGKVLYIPFYISSLINEFKLNEHYLFASNSIKMLLGEDAFIDIDHYQGMQVATFKKDNEYIINLVNGVGQRPLQNNVPLYDIEISLKIGEGRQVENVKELITEEDLHFTQSGDFIKVVLPKLNVWEAVSVKMKNV